MNGNGFLLCDRITKIRNKWKPVYDEYRKKKYRLKAENHLTLF